MLGNLPSLKKSLGAPLQSRKAMLETLFRHLDMVRLSVAALLVVALVGCTGLIDGGSSDGLTPQQKGARAQWQTGALPVFQMSCVSCHGGSMAGIGFLAGADEAAVRDTLMQFAPPVVNLEAPASSRVLSKGAHSGPALSGTDSFAILSWLQAEADAQASLPGSATPDLKIPAFSPSLCTGGLPDNAAGTCPTNHVALSALGDVGATVPGAEITFIAQQLTTALYLTDLKMVGGSAGIHFEHPLFVSRPATGGPIPDEIDRYFNLKQDTKPAVTDQIDGGTAAFEGFLPNTKLEIHFKTVAVYKPDTGGTMTGGCKVLASFKTNAVGPLKTNCLSCHANNKNASAQSALDITGVDSATDATILNACNQVRIRLNLTATDQSGIYLAPDMASATNHPFKFPAGQFTTNFKTPVDVWVQAEKTAP